MWARATSPSPPRTLNRSLGHIDPPRPREGMVRPDDEHELVFVEGWLRTRASRTWRIIPRSTSLADNPKPRPESFGTRGAELAFGRGSPAQAIVTTSYAASDGSVTVTVPSDASAFSSPAWRLWATNGEAPVGTVNLIPETGTTYRGC